MEKQKLQKVKKIGGIALNVFLWAFVVFSVIVTVITVSANANKKSVPVVAGSCYLSVLSDSMNAKTPDWVQQGKPKGFKTSDLIIGEYIAEDESEIAKLEVGDVITFEWDINNDGVINPGEYNTHRIIDIVYKADGSVDYYETRGDNDAMTFGKSEQVYSQNIIAKYTGKKIAGLGGMLTFLGSFLGFGLCIILPLAVFFVYELVVFIRTLSKVRNEGKKVITQEEEELIKQRAIEEYLRLQREKENNDNNSDPE